MSIIRNISFAALALVIAMPAAAESAPIPVNKAIAKVKTGDLNLSTTEGQADLAKRIERATKSVCATDMFGQLPTRSGEAKCRTATLAALRAHFKLGA